jgi:hypothetical protein
MAFIVDVRRGNFNLHLLYKALFELSADRAEFVSRMFSRTRPADLRPDASAIDLFGAFAGVMPDRAVFDQNLRAVRDLLTKTHGFALSSRDLETIEYVYDAFYTYGPAIQYSSTSRFGASFQPSYAELMMATDRDGVSRGYLASEEHFRFLKALEQRNLVVPVVGNFGGPRAVRAVGEYLKERHAAVSVFYLSNVEQYLRQDGLWQSFCRNVATLPIDETSTFIRSVRRPGNAAPGFGLVSELGSMMNAVESCPS